MGTGHRRGGAINTFQWHGYICRVRNLLDFIKKYLNWCSEDKQRSFDLN